MPDDFELLDAVKKIISKRESQIGETMMSGG